MRFRFIDLFAGIGGFRRGFESVGGKCVFACEWDRHCRQTYRANFPDDEHDIAGDIRQVHESDIPEHDLVLAGFPYQPFSLAGIPTMNRLNRPHGLAHEQNSIADVQLFNFYSHFGIERIVSKHRVCCEIENVQQ